MYEIIQDFTHPIFEEKTGPFVSIYQETHRAPSDTKQDSVRFKNLIKEVEGLLKEKHKKDIYEPMLKTLHEIRDNQLLWGHTQEGFVLFANPNYCVLFMLPRPVKTLTMVSNSLYTKPLIRHFQTVDMYHVLVIDKDNFKLYEGNRDDVKEVVIDPDIPTSKKEVLGDENEQSYLSHASYGGASGSTMYHGHHDKKQTFETDIERYFNYVDKFVHQAYSNKTEAPLILCALDEYQGVFKKISDNPYLLKKGIHHSTKELKDKQIKEKAWEILEPIYQEKITILVDKYRQAQTKKLGSNILADIARSVVKNKVETILIEENRVIPGKFDYETGKLNLTNINDTVADDVLDDLAQLVQKNGGSVFVLDKDHMPTDTGVAAIYRF